MDEVRPDVSQEAQHYELPEGTEIQVRPMPLAFSYKKLDGRWMPIYSNLAIYESLVRDDFPLGSVAIDPNGIGYVKGFSSCPQHSAGPEGPIQCLCMRSICWLRIGRVTQPALHGSTSHNSNIPAYQSSESVSSEDTVVPLRTGFQGSAGGLDLPNPLHGSEGHPQGAYVSTDSRYEYFTGESDRNPRRNEASGIERPSSIAHGFSEDIYQVFNEFHVSSAPALDQPRCSDAADDNLQDIRATLVPNGFTIHFNQSGGGIQLGDIVELDNEFPAFDDNASLGMKASIRFRFKCWQDNPDAKRYIDRRQQVKVRHGRKEGLPISLRAMAERVRSELVAEMTSMTELGYPLAHGGTPVQVEELILVRIERTKPGTLQPVLRLRR